MVTAAALAWPGDTGRFGCSISDCLFLNMQSQATTLALVRHAFRCLLPYVGEQPLVDLGVTIG